MNKNEAMNTLMGILIAPFFYGQKSRNFFPYLNQAGEKMTISGISSVYNSYALNTVSKALKTAQEIKSSFMVEEAPQEADLRGDLVKAKSVSLAEAEAFEGSVGNLDYTMYLVWQDPGVARQYAKMAKPPMVANITGTGSYSKSTAEARGQLGELVDKYFEEVKAEYGCSDDYMPYAPGMPEFDANIEQSMKRSLYDKVEADPEAYRLVQAVGGVWPPPDRLNLETMTYGPGAQTYGSGPWMLDRKV